CLARSARLLFFQLTAVLFNSLPPRSNHSHFLQLLRPTINFCGFSRNFRYSPVNSSPSLSTFFRLVQLPTAPIESRSFHSTSAPADQLLRIHTQLSILLGQLVSFPFNYLPS